MKKLLLSLLLFAVPAIAFAQPYPSPTFNNLTTLGAVTIGGTPFTLSGGYSTTLNVTGPTSVTLPTSGTLLNSTTSFASPPAIGSTTPNTGAFTTLSASGNDALAYQNASSQSIPNNSATTITNWSKISDRLNANFNASTGVFTAPATGYYLVNAGIQFSGSTSAAINDEYAITVQGNGVSECAGQEWAQSTSAVAHTANTSCIVSLTSGQTILVQAFQNSGNAVTLGANIFATYLSINRVP